jgi:hypothetical protein
MGEYEVFGNPLPRKAVASACRAAKGYARRFAFDPEKRYDLVAEPMGLAWDTFGIQRLVERTSPEGAGLTDGQGGVVIGTIRMGFGHYRMALAIASAARSMGLSPYWLDYLSFPESAASRTIAYLEKLYSLGSRLSQKSRLFNRLWERITLDVPQRISYVPRDREMCRLLAPIARGLPGGLPYLATHPWAGHAAVHAGIERVVNVVPDNYPLAFHLVEGALHVVQTPSAFTGYRSLRNMGLRGGPPLSAMPSRDIEYVGHYVDHEIVRNVEIDCERRLRRIADRKARRLLLTMGGAGAQVERFASIASFLKDSVDSGRACLLINMGDHEGRWLELRARLDSLGIGYTAHTDWNDTKAFAEELLDGEARGVHAFVHRDTFAAVYSTNLLMRAADVMVTKPSELSFYPVPKLFIQRVGRHEAWGAIRGAEIGDGTLETESTASLFQALRIVIEEDDLLELYCARILRNKADGIYDGAYQAVHAALTRKGG